MKIVDDVRALVPLLEARSSANERARHLVDEIVAAVVPTGAFRMYVPEVYSGPEIDPLTGIEVIATLSEADAATGWCATIASLTSHIAGVLDPVIAKEVFSDPTTIACGAFAPNGAGVRVDGGHHVSGRWAWGSGSQLSTWMTGGTVTDNGEFHQMIMPTTDVKILDTWYSAGLQGTGSHDFEAANVFVPEGRSVRLGFVRPQVDAPIARLSLFTLFSGGIASVMLGIARRSIRELTNLAIEKRPAQSSKTLAHSQLAQTDVARAEAIVRAGHAYLVHEIGSAWVVVVRGDRLSKDDRLRARLAASHVGAECCRAVDLMYAAGGGSAVYATSPLQRCFRDVHTAAAHVMVGNRAFETVGRHRFGLEIDQSSL